MASIHEGTLSSTVGNIRAPISRLNYRKASLELKASGLSSFGFQISGFRVQGLRLSEEHRVGMKLLHIVSSP